VERTYDIFEVWPDGHLMWRAAVQGHEAALNRMRELASESSNEFRMIHLGSNSVIAILRPADSQSSSAQEKCKKSKRGDDEGSLLNQAEKFQGIYSSSQLKNNSCITRL
jgi:hypothetical protein